MEEIEFGIIITPNGAMGSGIEIDCHKDINPYVEITHFERDGETWERLSTRPETKQDLDAEVAENAAKKYSWLIQEVKTSEWCGIVRKEMLYDESILQIPIPARLYQELSAKEKELAKKEKESVKEKLSAKKRDAKKVESKAKTHKQAVR